MSCCEDTYRNIKTFFSPQQLILLEVVSTDSNSGNELSRDADVVTVDEVSPTSVVVVDESSSCADLSLASSSSIGVTVVASVSSVCVDAVSVVALASYIDVDSMKSPGKTGDVRMM